MRLVIISPNHPPKGAPPDCIRADRPINIPAFSIFMLKVLTKNVEPHVANEMIAIIKPEYARKV